MERVVLDTNVLISAIISSKGSPAKILDLWREGAFDLVFSEETLKELIDVMSRPKLLRITGINEDELNRLLSYLRSSSIVVDSSEDISIAIEDPNDTKFISCAVQAGAKYIVSGDHHLLDVEKFEGTAIVTPAEFLRTFASFQNDS
ncbi:putative toxin-antitoxin system toxin component, PIN family [Mesotoga prima]|uniref:putative toxin-antitoxin system toxin component, PIN family n=1 Tax=Mesotoga prima TaxID=1184387 RepID=UPI0002CAEF3E|nr:putative toxin-antitoxin system toxin component, PIN family [Mesotoga prima]CCU83402.1 PilT protein domain protein [Mesotoga infera]HQC15101.1 putative toxin-antitoxin system toxin component, PIN family [Mesotoga prima]